MRCAIWAQPAELSGRELCLEKRIECRGFESHPRQLIFLRKSDCLRCAVLLCLALFVCLTLLASFFHLSLITCIYIHLQDNATHKEFLPAVSVLDVTCRPL